MKSTLVLLLTTLLFVSASCLQSFTIGNSRLDVGEEIRISSNRGKFIPGVLNYIRLWRVGNFEPH